MAEGGEGFITSVEEASEVISVSDRSVANMTTKENVDAVDIILQRSISDRENELRQIQLDNRPVTGQTNRSNIGQFLAKNIQLRDNVEAQHASGKENVPLNSMDVEEHRPEAVVVEIQGLSQQQRVSSVLQTAAFRRHLEGIIRGSLGTVVRSRSAASSARPSPSPAPTQPASPSPSPAPTQPATPIRDLIPQRDSVPETNIERHDSVSSGSSSSSSAISFIDYNNRIHDPRGLLNAHLNPAVAAPAPPAPALPLQDLPIRAPLDPLSMVHELHREDLVQEVSELVHRRLVTSTLEGDFRNVLEFHVGERVQATGSDGQRVANFVRSIPQTQPHIQNDFSELGINAPGADNWDTVSVTSISATAVPYTQTNLHMSREIAALKGQLQEMKNMMKVSFDLQLDIQRAIRQEVAAGIAAATGQINRVPDATGQTASTAAIPRSKPVNDTHCLICLDNHSDSVLYQCGHMCVCFPCGRHLMDRGAKCPVCRAPIRDIIRAYKCNED